MKWSEEQTYQFVKQYMKNENLWYTRHELYKISNAREQSYKNIISEFRKSTGIEMNVAELKMKIKSLRSTYCQELAKIRRRSSADRTFQSNLKWFSYWHKCIINAKKGHYISTDNHHDETIDDPSEVWVSQTTNSDNTSTDPFPDDEGDMIVKEDPDNSFTRDHEPSNHSVIKRKTYEHHSTCTEFSGRTFGGSTDLSESRREDEFDIYGKYIASQLRNMELQKALKVQLEIQSLVSEARISDLVQKH